MINPSHTTIGPMPSWRPPEAEPGWGAGAWWALGVHAVLLAILAFSVNWQQSEPAPIEAEMWSEIPRVAGGAVSPPPLAATPTPVRRMEVPKPVAPEPEVPRARPPDIVVEKKPDPPKPERKPEVKKPEPPKKEVVKPVESKVTQAQSKGLTAAELEAQRQANLQRMMSSLGDGVGAGQAAKSSGPSAEYAGRIIARVKPHIRLIETLEGNPQAVVEVRCGPDGRIISRRLVQSSGEPIWDDTVLRALDRAEVLPADVDGRVPSPMQLFFKLHDF